MDNIYADYGSIINNDRYINRVSAEEQVRSRLLSNQSYGSLGLVGLQRMGKSSLAYNLIESKRAELLKQKVMVIKLVMYNYKTVSSFFYALADAAMEILEDCDEVSAKLERRYNRTLDTPIEENGGERLRSFFKTIVSEMGYRVICIIDEFAYSRKLFQDYPEGFFVLRELAYQPENKIGFLFLSRHLMAELESGVGYDVSNFSNILVNSYITLYSEAEFNRYFEIMAESGVDIDEDIKNHYLDITGRVPYWMDILSFHYVNEIQSGNQKNLYDIFDDNYEIFYGEFQRYLDLLKDQDLLNCLYQVVLGPLGDDATPKQISRLKNYGIIEGTEESGYTTVSKYFRQYMIMKEQTIEFYPLWNRTEKLLRKVAETGLTAKYGIDWENAIHEAYVTDINTPRGHKKNDRVIMDIGDYILSAESTIEQMRKKEAVYEIASADINMLNGTTTGGLGEILCREYEDCFEKVFKMPLKEFRPLIQNITAARNPYDHNNDHLIREDVKVNTTENCTKLIKLMEAYLGLK